MDFSFRWYLDGILLYRSVSSVSSKEKCFKAELEQKLLMVDEQVGFQSQMAVELGTPFPKNTCILSYIMVCGRHDPDRLFYLSFVACKSQIT